MEDEKQHDEKKISVFVFNIPNHWTEDTLCEHFEGFGDFLQCNIVENKDGSHKGYGFVDYGSVYCARAAIEEMNGYDADGKYLKVDFKNGSKNDSAKASAPHAVPPRVVPPRVPPSQQKPPPPHASPPHMFQKSSEAEPGGQPKPTKEGRVYGPENALSEEETALQDAIVERIMLIVSDGESIDLPAIAEGVGVQQAMDLLMFSDVTEMEVWLTDRDSVVCLVLDYSLGDARVHLLPM